VRLLEPRAHPVLAEQPGELGPKRDVAGGRVGFQLDERPVLAGELVTDADLALVEVLPAQGEAAPSGAAP
jgi:hypothetical protein